MLLTSAEQWLDKIWIESRGALDRAKFRPDGTVYAWPFGDSMVYISIRDELGKVNLNQAPETLLSALFVSAKLLISGSLPTLPTE
jgi:hypothetical protein